VGFAPCASTGLPRMLNAAIAALNRRNMSDTPVARNKCRALLIHRSWMVVERRGSGEI
jgi:hypothetical protein